MAPRTTPVTPEIVPRRPFVGPAEPRQLVYECSGALEVGPFEPMAIVDYFPPGAPPGSQAF